MNLNKLENSISNLEEEVSSLKGKVSLLSDQYAKTIKKLTSLKELQITNAKSIGLLDLIQKATTEIIKETFEGIVTKALQYVYQNDGYSFELEFDKRGNNPTMKFLLKSPDMQESHDIVNTRPGGAKDIVALALRLVLLEISRNKGFLFLDEPFKRLDNEETIKNTINFIKETQQDTKRQTFIITHKDEVVNSVPNPIIFKENKIKLRVIDSNKNELTESKEYELSDDTTIKFDKSKKKRGRPKGSKNKRRNND